MQQRIAFIGLGIMGGPIAGHLLAAGHQLTINTRTRQRAQPLIDGGATWQDTPQAAATGADFVFICVPDTPDVEQVAKGEHGIFRAAHPDQIVIDHSTISPSATRSLAEAASSLGIHWLDAPVSGGDAGAKNASLSIMVGGEPSTFDRALPLLKLLGKTITHCGPSGSGQLTKLVNQILVSVTNLAVSEALAFARANGLQDQKTLQAISGGAGGSWQLANLGPRMLAGDFAPGFMINLQQKDLRLTLDAAAENGLALQAVPLVQRLFEQAQAEDRGKQGTQALFAVLEKVIRGR